MVETLFVFVSIITTIITYAWSEHGFITLISSNKPIFNKLFELRGFMIYSRHLFEAWFITTITIITLIQLYFVFKKGKKVNLKIIILGVFILSLAYSFLSTDIFSYIFSARILYFYKLNPYSTIPESLRDKDIWLSFTYWTHRPYIYGPIALLVSLIPFAIFGSSKFLSIFYASKIINGGMFIATGIIISKLLRSRKKAVYLWFTNPLLLIELVINAHNENVMMFLFFLSLFFWKNNKKLKGLLALIFSILTKYVSLLFSPLIFIRENVRTIMARIMVVLGITLFLSKYNQMQLWYFSWIYFALPFAKIKKRYIALFFVAQSLLIITKYLKFIGSGNW